MKRITVVIAMTVACGAPRGHVVSDPTFTRDVAPTLFARCSGCHRPGGVAPFSVLDYATVRSHRDRIVTAITSGAMPPWLPQPGCASFANERRLRPDEISTISRWAETGAPEGNANDLPPAPTLAGGWQLGTPDLVVEMPEAFVLAPTAEDVFRNFVIPIPLTERRFVRGIEFRSDNPGVVHHAMLGIDRSGVSRRLDEEDPEPGFDGMRSEAQSPIGHFLGWTPGKVPFMEPSEVAWPLDPGSDLVVQLHMLPRTDTQAVRATVGFFFSGAPPTRTPFLVKLGSKTIDVPAGEANYRVSDSYVLPVDVNAVSIYPHAHYLAREMKAAATLPDGTTRCLLAIERWDFHWQDEYRYLTPIFLPRGTRLTMVFTYDNSSANHHNAHRPPRRVVHGPRSSDEMGDLWLQVLPERVSDVGTLLSEYNERELRSDIAGAEQAIIRTPGDAGARNFLGTRYMRASEIEKAIGQFEEALRLEPTLADAHANYGVALQSAGQVKPAIGHLRQALALAPGDARVHFNMALAFQADGQSAKAIDHFRKAISLNPTFAQAHSALGVVLGAQDRLGEAVEHFRRALALAPNDADTHNNLGVALGLLGENAEAVQHFQEALRLQPGHKEAARNLAVHSPGTAVATRNP